MIERLTMMTVQCILGNGNGIMQQMSHDGSLISVIEARTNLHGSRAFHGTNVVEVEDWDHIRGGS